MAPPAYPASLPQNPLVEGFNDTRQKAALRSDMDTGAPKRRKRFTAAIRPLKFPTILNGTQRVTFDTFYKTTLGEGSLSFTIPDPVDGNTITVFFVAPPKFNIIGASGTAAATRQWQSIYNLEVLP